MTEEKTKNIMEELKENELVDDWFSSIEDSSARQYSYLFKQFLEHFDITPEQLKEEAENKKSGVKTKTRLNKWYKYLEKQGNSPNYCKLAESAVRSFLLYHEIEIKRSKRKTYPKHRREVLRREDITDLVQAAPHLRDKALIILAFQTGMSISDLLDLDYGDIKDAIEKDQKTHHVIRYIRGKAKTPSVAVFGQDSINLLRQYIDWRKQRGDILMKKTPLFTGVHSSADKRFSKRGAQNMMRNTIVKAGLTTFEQLKEYGKFNPYGFHAVRKAFSSVASIKGLPKDQTELSMGHTRPYNGAYEGFTDEELANNYKGIENHLSVFSHVKELEEKTKELEEKSKEDVKEMKDTIKQLKDMIWQMAGQIDLNKKKLGYRESEKNKKSKKTD